MPTTFQYVSDIHTEMYNVLPKDIYTFPFTPQASYLILGGDIGYPFHRNYYQFLSQLSPLFEHIFIIAGNHEYYQTKYDLVKATATAEAPGKSWMAAVDTRIREVVASFDNMTFLQNETYDIPDTNLTVFGGTFWSDILPEEQENVRRSLADYRYIPEFTPQKSRELFQTSCRTLQAAMVTKPERDFVVISHHLPSYTLVAEQYKSMEPPINSAFASEIVEAQSPQIKAWVAGHTHTPMELGKFHVNPFGYPTEAKRHSATFNKTFTVG